MIAVGLLGLVAAGCGDAHRPSVRGVPIEPEKEGTEAKAPADSFHGNMPQDSIHSGMPKDSFHGGMAGMGGETEGASAESLGPEVDLGSGRMTAPKGWTRGPGTSITKAVFKLPRAEGDSADGRLTVTQAGGGLKENIDRWRGQFGGKPSKESEKKVKAAGVDVTVVDFSGTFADPFSKSGEQPSYRMLGAIFELGGKMFFVKAIGPEKTIAARSGEFDEFVQSLKTK